MPWPGAGWKHLGRKVEAALVNGAWGLGDTLPSCLSPGVEQPRGVSTQSFPAGLSPSCSLWHLLSSASNSPAASLSPGLRGASWGHGQAPSSLSAASHLRGAEHPGGVPSLWPPPLRLCLPLAATDSACCAHLMPTRPHSALVLCGL